MTAQTKEKNLVVVKAKNLRERLLELSGGLHGPKFPCHYPLEMGHGVSIRADTTEALAATVMNISRVGEVVLELVAPDPPSSPAKGQRVQIKYWREETLYCWDAEVIKEGKNESVTVLISEPGVSLNQRKFLRIPLSLSFSFTVVGPAESQTRGERFSYCHTQEISLGGLGFQTPVSLSVGDRLDIDLQLSPLQQTNALGWVVRCEPQVWEGKTINGVGVQFLQTEEEQSKLLDFLSSFRTQSEDV